MIPHGTPKLQLEPFPYAWMEDWLDPDVYAELAQTRPDTLRLFSGAAPNTRHDVPAKAALKAALPPVWREFIEYCTSCTFWDWWQELFGPALELYYPRLDRSWERLARIDCQIAIDTPPVEKGTVRGPHVDNPVELIGAMFYMPRENEDTKLGGDLALFRYVDTPQLWGKAELKPRCVTEFARVPYSANTFVAFINTMDSVHGVTPREAGAPPRRMVSLCVELDKPLFNPERYRIEARRSNTRSWGLPAQELSYG